eukprot:Phypoly_transcript_08398.p1 GENE.Phypoly_transcript_08398~~Phypoly_transcript_08398.p1  ORF type:complete len:494 (+),score=91.17 Phypoly_transcript_08398:33-1484(+)
MNSVLLLNQFSGCHLRCTVSYLIKCSTPYKKMHYIPPEKDKKQSPPNPSSTSSSSSPSSSSPHSHSDPSHSHPDPSSHSHSHSDLHHHLELTSKEGIRITYIGLGFNILLVSGKLFAGVIGRSAAMIADAAHSLSDILSDIVTLWSVKLSSKPVDENHPYGHGKFDSIGSLAVSGLLVATSIGIGYHSISAAFEPESPTQIAFWAALASIVIKELLFRATMAIGKKRRSGVLMAHAWHHRSDAYSSLVTLIGIGGAMMGIRVLDPLAGFAVSVMIMNTAYQLGTSSIRELTDTVASEDVQQITKLIENAEGVLSFSDIRVRKMGPYTIVDLNIQVDNRISVSAAGQIAERVRRTIQTNTERVKEVMVHVTGQQLRENANSSSDEPLMRPQDQIEADVRRVLSNIPEIQGISHFLMHYENGEVTVHIDIVVDNAKTVADARRISQKAHGEIIMQVKDIHHVDLHLELDEEDVQRVLHKESVASK